MYFSVSIIDTRPNVLTAKIRVNKQENMKLSEFLAHPLDKPEIFGNNNDVFRKNRQVFSEKFRKNRHEGVKLAKFLAFPLDKLKGFGNNIETFLYNRADIFRK